MNAESDIYESSRVLRKAARNFWLRKEMAPVDFTRTREIPMLLNLVSEAGLPATASVVDIASPQLISTHLARQNSGWDITYLNSFEPELRDLELSAQLLRLANLHTAKKDARNPDSLPPESIDLVISSSVLEHVLPVGDENGDSVVMRNIARWLKPGGSCVLTIPYAKSGFDEYKKNSEYVAEAEEDDGSYFFQRFYDSTSLARRILNPSGLKCVKKAFVGERLWSPNDRNLRPAKFFGSFWSQVFLGKLYPVLGKLFLTPDSESHSLKQPYLAGLLLSKE